MKLFNRQKSELAAFVDTPAVEPPAPKPTTKNVVMQLVLSNNKTDKEHILKSINNFGLGYDFLGSKDNIYQSVRVKQYLSSDCIIWRSEGVFIDYSVVNLTWQTFKIEEDGQ